MSRQATFRHYQGRTGFRQESSEQPTEEEFTVSQRRVVLGVADAYAAEDPLSPREPTVQGDVTTHQWAGR